MNTINKYLFEAFLFNDKTISIDLDKFESGEIPRLLIIGYSGSGKSIIGRYLSKKYKKELLSLDGCIFYIRKKYSKKGFKEQQPYFKKCVKDSIYQKGIIEGLQLLQFDKFKLDKNFLIKQPVIILGTSLIISSIKAAWRNSTEGFENEKGQTIKMYFWGSLIQQGFGTNFKELRKKLNQFKKDRMNVKGSNVKEFIIPKLS